MTREPSLVEGVAARHLSLTRRILAGYAACVLLGFAALGEILARSALARSADVIQSLLGTYADPGGERTTVAPDMLAGALLGLGDPARLVILRTVGAQDGMPKVYYLSPGMPAKLIERAGLAASPEEVRQHIATSVGSRGRDILYHRNAGDFDLFLTASRGPGLMALGGLGLLTIILLPLASILSRRTLRSATATSLAPLDELVRDTQAIEPSALSRRVRAPTGVHELTIVGSAVNALVARVEASHEALARFTADVSHELRTPLTNLRAQVQWALDGERTPAELRETLAAIGTTVDQSCQLIEGLLVLARGDSRELEPRLRDFDVREVADEVAEIAAVLSADRMVSVAAEHDGPVTAHGDPEYTRQILLNFVTNAARYTARGSIVVTVHRERESAVAAVRDTGPGIAPHQLPRVFDRFYRADASRSREHGGAGLGLAIARTLATAQRARVSATSALGEGSTFTLELPASRDAWMARDPSRDVQAPQDENSRT